MIVKWDGIPDLEGWEDSRESVQQLLPSMYNKDNERVWRMVVNVEVCEAYYCYFMLFRIIYEYYKARGAK